MTLSVAIIAYGLVEIRRKSGVYLELFLDLLKKNFFSFFFFTQNVHLFFPSPKKSYLWNVNSTSDIFTMSPSANLAAL